MEGDIPQTRRSGIGVNNQCHSKMMRLGSCILVEETEGIFTPFTPSGSATAVPPPGVRYSCLMGLVAGASQRVIYSANNDVENSKQYTLVILNRHIE